MEKRRDWCWGNGVYQKPNWLLLDEPTNHLDLVMRHVLVEALQSFESAVCVVSHDRFLLNMVADRFCLVEQGKIEECEYSTGKSRWLQVTAKSRIDRPYGRLSPLPSRGEGVKKLLPPKGVGF